MSEDEGQSRDTMTAGEFTAWAKELLRAERDQVNMAIAHAIWAEERGDDSYPPAMTTGQLRREVYLRHERSHGRPSDEGAGGEADREPTQREELRDKLLMFLSRNNVDTVMLQLIEPLVWEVAEYVYDAGDLVQALGELGWQPISGNGGKEWKK